MEVDPKSLSDSEEGKYILLFKRNEWRVVIQAAKERIARRRAAVLDPFDYDERISKSEPAESGMTSCRTQSPDYLVRLLREHGEFTEDSLQEISPHLRPLRRVLGTRAVSLAEEISQEVSIFNATWTVDAELVQLLGQ